MNHFYKELVFISLALATIGCAKQSSPTGGPKDVTPPVALRSSPVNYSTNFKGKKFIVEFDEFIDLKNVNQELLVSPIVENKPKVVMRGKKMVVRINNELADSTTYNFNFFNSITDLNEGNVLKNFQFEFSTGPTFDSIYIGGRLTDAFSGAPVEGAYVMLYTSLSDSTPRTQKPDCIGRTNKEGYFVVPNMKPVPYYMFALVDMNNNQKYDLPNEKIAFSDSSFMPSFKPMEVSDTIRQIEHISRDRKDTVFRDSIHTYTIMVTTIDDVKLNLFAEEYHIQYLHDVYRPNKRLLSVAFNDVVDSSFSIAPVTDSAYNPDWLLIESTMPTDSVVLWIKDSNLYKHDTLNFAVSYTMKDSNNTDYLKTDTLEFLAKNNAANNKKQNKKKEGGLLSKLKKDEKDESEKEEKKESELKITSNIRQQFDLKQPINLSFTYPIADFNSSLISMSKIDDDKSTAVDCSISRDNSNLRSFSINFNSEESTTYEVLIAAGAFTDIYGNINDTLRQSFATLASDFYCTLILNIKNVQQNSIFQLLGSKNSIVKEIKLHNDTTLTISYLRPEKYQFKLFYDVNNNGKWDTGKFSEQLQPEKVFLYDDVFEAKTGWDIEYTWILE